MLGGEDAQDVSQLVQIRIDVDCLLEVLTYCLAFLVALAASQVENLEHARHCPLVILCLITRKLET